MSKTIAPAPVPYLPTQLQQRQFHAGADETHFSTGGRKTRERDAREYADDNHQSFGQRDDSDATLSQRFALFERTLHQAARDRSSRRDDDEDQADGDVIQVLFETGQQRSHGGSPAPAQQSEASPTEARAERIFKQVSMRIDAAIRPGPSVSPGPVRITIPVDPADVGSTRIEVTLSDALVTVKLYLPAASSPAEASPQLLGAASQLGLLLQAHLPGRQIRIVQAAASPDEPQYETGSRSSGQSEARASRLSRKEDL